MNNIINKSKPLLYIHIPKTAGVSVNHSGIISKENWKNHKRAIEIKELHKYFSFAFIRNPYEKVLSSYNFYKKNNEKGNKIHKKIISEYNSFKSLILDYKNISNLIPEHFKYTQCDYVCDKNKNIVIDYWGYFKTIDKSFIEVQEKNNLNNIKKLDIKKNVTKHKDYRSYYDDETAEIIYNHWKDDFEIFNFDKNSYKI